MKQIKTVTSVTTTESEIPFDAFYPYVWIENQGDSDCYAANYAGFTAQSVDVAMIKAGTSKRIDAKTKSIYVKTASGTTTLEVHGQNDAINPFKSGVKGGESITIDPTPTQGSGNAVSSGGVYTALQGISPVDYSTTEQNTGRKWIDSKPIYQKTFVSTAPATYWEGINNTVDVSELNIDTLIGTEAQAQNATNGNYFPLSMASTPSNTIVINSTKSNILIYLGDNQSPTRVFNFTIWYTKTTDTAE